MVSSLNSLIRFLDPKKILASKNSKKNYIDWNTRALKIKYTELVKVFLKTFVYIKIWEKERENSQAFKIVPIKEDRCQPRLWNRVSWDDVSG